MNIAGSEPLQRLLERERSDRDATALALRQAQAHGERLERQVRQFERHRADYAQHWQQSFHEQGGIEIVHCYRSFLQRLDQALVQLRAQQTQAQSSIKRTQLLLADAERRVAAIEKLLQRRAEQARQRIHRQEQKLTDEAAQRKAWPLNSAQALGAAVP